MMKQPGFGTIAALVCLAAGAPARAQLLTPAPTTSGAMPGPLATLDGVLTLNSALAPPEDDVLLDASGNPVLDADGKPVSDPNETFHQVKPFEYDPNGTKLVQAAWLGGTGCPASPPPEADTPCVSATGDDTDLQDHANEGLLLYKTGFTSNNASAGAELKKVRGIHLTELGYDIRKPALSTDPRGSHCGAGSPRFNVLTKDDFGQQHFYFIGCNSPAPAQTPISTGWVRLRWGAPVPAFEVTSAGVVPGTVTGTVQRIQIIFDEAQDPSGGPDTFGSATLDNIDVNGELVGHGPTDAATR